MDKVMIIDDDEFFHQMIKDCLLDKKLISYYSGEEALENIQANRPDLILLDIQMGGIDGYKTCQKIKSNVDLKDIPVIFISSLDEIEDRLKAYSSGAIDYINKPIVHDELKLKVNQFLDLQQRSVNLIERIALSHIIVNNAQKSASDNQVINRFVQSSMQCHNFQHLVKLFFVTANELNLNCILKIKLTPTILESSNIDITQLESKIIDYSDQMNKIFSFGHNRCMFNWPNAVLLLRNDNDNQDIVAILMDALETAINAIDTEEKILSNMQNIEIDNNHLQEDISEIFTEMHERLSDSMITLGLVSQLDEEVENQLMDIIKTHETFIQTRLKNMSENNNRIQGLFNELRTPSNELIEILRSHDSKSDNTDNDVIF